MPRELLTVTCDLGMPEDLAYVAEFLFHLMDLEAAQMQDTIEALAAPHIFAFMRTTVMDSEKCVIGMVPAELLTIDWDSLKESESSESRP